MEGERQLSLPTQRAFNPFFPPGLKNQASLLRFLPHGAPPAPDMITPCAHFLTLSGALLSGIAR